VKLSIEAAMAILEAPWELTGEGKEKGKERRGRGRPRGVPMEVAARGGHGDAASVGSLFVRRKKACLLREGESSRERKEKQRRKKEREEKENEGKEKRKIRKISKLENF
jgi:hypothetical protein